MKKKLKMSCIVFANNPPKKLYATVQVPVSKSVGNRQLIIDFLCGFKRYKNAEEAWSQDLVDLWNALEAVSAGQTLISIGESGTALRFLSSLLSIQKGRKFILTGESRIPERPMRVLVEALKLLNAKITYLEKEGFAPLAIEGNQLTSRVIKLDGSASSQFASSLLLIAPFIEGGLEIEISEGSKSLSYLTLSIDLLKENGAQIVMVDKHICVQAGLLSPSLKKWPADWSSIPYFIAFAACAEEAEIKIPDVIHDASQADFAAFEIFERYFGVHCEFSEEGLTIRKTNKPISKEVILLNGNNFPDLVPTLFVCAAILGRDIEISEIAHLSYKESDRIAVLTSELGKIGYTIVATEKGAYRGSPAENYRNAAKVQLDAKNDHRMAMSFSLLSFMSKELSIQGADSVKKSFPRYWEMLSNLGLAFDIT